MINITSIKAKTRNLASQIGLSANIILRMYFFERFLMRLSKSLYKDKFIIKGGFLISSIIGITNRTTIDIDTNIKDMNLEQEMITNVIKEIINIDINDGVEFIFTNIEIIREIDYYDNFRISLVAMLENTRIPLKLDITTGDPITPSKIVYEYSCLLTSEKIRLYAYNIETIIAEKYETIIVRNIETTRMKDFYDVYMIFKLKHNAINFKTLKRAIFNTSNKRKTTKIIKDSKEILNNMQNNSKLINEWEKFMQKNSYAADIKFFDTIEILKTIADIIV
ncbi:MAG: nucleotidyl transferase AbiEii/AbiGii toxin family protein [Bacilli bacterium]|jgi:predicted nucleotidyltransferase component of viral defense system|nr:nucleotidyl transferase AbiEii/AbiGii toxin family protein [Bacillota bacterium]NLI52145.1 nucleotidyl transferase AbiEii/AbiGii toxin family protein [Erysipelotrichaceae bacterium]OQC49781.1 MAG: hypothetical protein BWX57_00734 [Tenericutes bacterium ADurb.Bin024]HOE53798.1 nucleotidyl transferase AbiEii/AbiGii toxin family protein [Bacilli bacterium]HOQ70668.1 nucleotidyl transferase AbiEii/AbiGii toxin family protein [Bacilli bacterium]